MKNKDKIKKFFEDMADDTGISLEDIGLQRRDATTRAKTTEDLASQRPTTQGNSSDMSLNPAYLLPVGI